MAVVGYNRGVWESKGGRVRCWENGLLRRGLRIEREPSTAPRGTASRWKAKTREATVPSFVRASGDDRVRWGQECLCHWAVLGGGCEARCYAGGS